MNTILQKLRNSLGGGAAPEKNKAAPVVQLYSNPHVIPDKTFPLGSHVFGIHQTTKGHLIVGAGDPETGVGSVFIRLEAGNWKEIPLPDETAWLSYFLELPDGSLVASGMTLLGRAAILTCDANLENWKSIDIDLHPFSMINSLIQLPSGDLLAATGKMITQGKTKPVFLRSKDLGKTWLVEDISLPITQFFTLTLAGSRLYAGPCGDHSPVLYYTDDEGKTWVELPKLPSFKTYKTIALRPIMHEGKEKILALVWGYKIDIADRVVRLYVTNETGNEWEEQPTILDSHFVFSFYIDKDQTFYAGSEKGMFLVSKDLGKTWTVVQTFPTNIGAYAIFKDTDGCLWIGKDFVAPDHLSLWRFRG